MKGYDGWFRPIIRSHKLLNVSKLRCFNFQKAKIKNYLLQNKEPILMEPLYMLFPEPLPNIHLIPINSFKYSLKPSKITWKLSFMIIFFFNFRPWGLDKVWVIHSRIQKLVFLRSIILNIDEKITTQDKKNHL